MDNRLYKKILLSLLSLFLIIGCVTYQPQKADAIAGKIASYAAKKAAVWVAKETAEESIQKILKKKIDIGDPLFQKYISRVDYDLVQVDGKTFLMRNNLGAAEKKALGDQIGKVVDRMMYGENAAWLSWVDWWSIGPMLLIGNVIYSEMTDENYSFINDVLMQALIDLGFLEEPQDNFTDSKTKEPIQHYESPPPTSEPEKNLNYSQVIELKGTPSNAHSATLPLNPYRTPMAIGTYVVELVPNAPVASLFKVSSSNSWTLSRVKESPIFDFDVSGGNTFWNKFGDWEDKVDIYKNNVKTHSDLRSVDLSNFFDTTILKKINRYIYSWDKSKGQSVVILQSTVDTSVPIYKFVIKGVVNKQGISQPDQARTAFYTSPELNNVGFKVYQDYFTDRIITPPTARPAPQLKDVKPSNPKDYVSGPIINNNPNTGKPTMAIPTTVIVQDPTSTPVKSDPAGGITITKPDGTPVTDPETELEPVTNEPVVQPNPTTGEPEIIVKPNTPPEPATPPKTDPPTTENPDTGDPDTGDPETETPPTDPDDEDPTKVKWDKLKSIPTFMTTRFPFSLPWDIGRFMDAVFPDVTPITELVFEFPDIADYDTSFEIRIPEYFEPWMDFARSAFIYGFDISLVYAIYRLFGGAQ
ncbi:hypothetical protein [Exiguobacterium acetylicum]|uniref:Uncharacterized protein n=1 Tax=Exiguobacterium acetylicum TaxID=41170 RepID=A0ABX8GFX5_EXIAC|nr:hypothetical protein [Exiguobacterium acetylicum]QWB31950.1 hypothetical protein KKI46_17295 [Exiguobacterium acetylicum]